MAPNMSDSSNPAFLVDGIKSIAIHNDVARIQFMQLGLDGRPEDNVCILLPMKQAPQVADTLRQLATRK